MREAGSHDPLDVARRFVARAPIHMLLADLEGRILEFSPTFLKTLVDGGGYRREDLVGLRIFDIETGATEARAAATEIFARLAAGEPEVHVEVGVTLLSGRELTVRIQASYWRDTAGAPVGILYIHQDVTAETQAEAGRRRSEEQLRAVVDNLPAEVALLNLETGEIQLMNAGFAAGTINYLGACVGQDYRKVLPPADVAALERRAAQAEAAGGRLQTERDENHSRTPGTFTRVTHIVFRDSRGHRQLLWISEDITELRRSSEALKRAAAEAAAANRAKSEFLANMSHEIRTPLNGVMGVAGALAKTALGPAQREMVRLVETSAKTLETLLSDILDLARIEAGKIELKPEPFDLAASVEASGALFDAAAQAKGLDLEVRVAPEALGAYVGDAARLRQILANLLGNAVKFTTLGKVTLTVGARRGETASELRFEVRDTGIGFDEETKARLFSRFEQADGSITRRFGGSGLGLAISRSLAEAMGGRLEADAVPGEGAVFTLVLELPRVEGGLDLWAEDVAPEAPAPDPLAGLRVLLAEDHPTNRRVVELILGAAGVELTSVENGVEAVDAFRRGAFDLILMDMQMPLMDGLSAIEEIRRIEAAAGMIPTPIHVLTANAMPEHIAASAAAGADGHLSKPIVADALLERVALAVAPPDRSERLKPAAPPAPAQPGDDAAPRSQPSRRGSARP